MPVFGKRRRVKRVAPERGKLPDRDFRALAPAFPQKRLKIFMVFLLALSSLYVVHMGHFLQILTKAQWIALPTTAVILALLNWAFWYFAFHFQREVVASVKRFMLVGVMVLGTFLAARQMVKVPAVDVPVNLLYLIPVVFTVLTFAIVFNRQFALFITGYMAVVLGLIFKYTPDTLALEGKTLLGRSFVDWVEPEPGLFPALLVLAGSGIIAALATGRIRDRSRLIKVGVVIGVVQAVLIISAEALGNVYHPHLGSFDYTNPLWGMAYCLMVGFLVSGALPFIEHFFEVTTDISLIELSDHNHPLLRRLLLEAPGTFHHSFITGTLAESAAEAIGANSLLARVGGYFHDIGKIYKPEYFTENETQKGSHHARLSPTISTLIILAHTKDGIELAKDYNLPPAIIDFIPQHHGTSVIEYFYREAIEQSAGRFEVRKEYFRYLGPKPRTRETAIVSIADSVEAASRSLSDPSPARIAGLVHNIVTTKLMDDQLDDCPLTFREIKILEDTFLRVLAGIYHGRIAYPDLQKK